MTYAETQVNNKLDQYIQRVQRLEEEKKNIMSDIKEVKAELKAEGYDVKIFNMVLKLLEMDPDKRQEQDYLLDTYRKAAGISG